MAELEIKHLEKDTKVTVVLGGMPQVRGVAELAQHHSEQYQLLAAREEAGRLPNGQLEAGLLQRPHTLAIGSTNGFLGVIGIREGEKLRAYAVPSKAGIPSCIYNLSEFCDPGSNYTRGPRIDIVSG